MTPKTPPPEFYVGWGTLAFINAGLAQSKNRSRLNWFLASLILGARSPSSTPGSPNQKIAPA